MAWLGSPKRAAQLLVTAANLERGYQAFHGSGNLQVFRGRRSRSAGGKAIEDDATTRMRTREQGNEEERYAQYQGGFGWSDERAR